MSKPFDFRDAFIKSILSNQREWSHDRAKTLGASEVFGCIRRSWFLKHTPDEADEEAMSMGAAHRGNIIENHFVVPTLRDIFGPENIKYDGEDQASFVSGLNSATPDGLIFPKRRDILAKYGIPDIGADCFGMEIKSIDPRIHLHEEKQIHRGQGIVQLGMFRELTPYKPEYVVILYVNAADFYDIRPFIVRYDQQIYDNAKARAAKVYATEKPYDVPAEGKHNDQCRYCPFKAACSAAEAEAHPGKKTIKDELSLGEQEQLDLLAAQYHEALQAEKALAETKSKASEGLKRLLNAMGTKKASSDAFVVNHALMDGKETLDKKAMREDGINPDDYKKTGSSFTRLTVTAK